MMPWRMRYLTTRAHPLAIASYCCTFLLGFCLTFGLFGTRALSGVDPLFDWTWRLELLTGGLAGMVLCSIRPRISPGWPDLADLLRLEAIGAFVGGSGFVIYAYSITELAHEPTLPATVLGAMGLGMVTRSIQAFIEGRRAQHLAAVYDQAQEALKTLEHTAQKVSQEFKDNRED